MAVKPTSEMQGRWFAVLKDVTDMELVSSKEEVLLFLTGWMSGLLAEQSNNFKPAVFKKEAFKIIYADMLSQPADSDL